MAIHSRDRKANASHTAYLTTCDLVVAFTFDLLTSKFNHFMFMPNCTEVVNLVKFPQAVCKTTA